MHSTASRIKWTGIILTLFGLCAISMGLFFYNSLGLDANGLRRLALLLLGFVFLPSILIIRPQSRFLLLIENLMRSVLSNLPHPLFDLLDFLPGPKKKLALDWKPVVLWLLCVIPAVFLSLHILAIVPFVWEHVPLTNIVPIDGFAYQSHVSTAGIVFNLGEVPGAVYENGAPLPFHVVTGYDSVVQKGLGRYYLTPNVVYFSASDSSDPRVNEKQYEIVRPILFSFPLLLAAYVLGGLATFAIGIRYRSHLRATLNQPPFYLAAIIFCIPFVISRLWIFLDFPLVAIHPDSGSYYALAEQIGSGVLPQFSMRPPMYPLLMKITFSFLDRAIALAAVQCFLSFASGLCMVYATHRLQRRLSVLAALAMAGYFYSVTALEQDTAFLAESLYTSCLMFSFAFLLLGFSKEGNLIHFSVSSVAMVCAILTRPQGMFLYVTYLMVLVFMLWNKYARRLWIAFLLPMPFLLLVFNLYNYFTLDSFATSVWGEANLAVGTFTFWEKDNRYPPEINATIDSIQKIIQERFNITGVSRDVLLGSWSPQELSPIFVQGFNGPALDRAMNMGGKSYNNENRYWIRTVAFDSITKHPDIYTKFVYTMLWLYYHGISSGSDFDFRAYLINRASVMYVDKLFSRERENAFMVRLGKEFADGTPPTAITIADDDPVSKAPLNERILLAATPAWRAYYVLHLVRRTIFANSLWSIAFFIVLILSTLELLRSKGRHWGAFVLFILTVSAFGASLVISLVEYSQPRYSYPMEWVYYLSVVLLPLLFVHRYAKKVPETDQTA